MSINDPGIKRERGTCIHLFQTKASYCAHRLGTFLFVILALLCLPATAALEPKTVAPRLSVDNDIASAADLAAAAMLGELAGADDQDWYRLPDSARPLRIACTA